MFCINNLESLNESNSEESSELNSVENNGNNDEIAKPNHSCSNCNQGFQSAIELMAHIASEHPELTDKQYKKI